MDNLYVANFKMIRAPADIEAGILPDTRQVVLIDIDGVVLDNLHRLHHICEIVDGVQRQRGPDTINWAGFHAEAEADTAGAAIPMALRHMWDPQYQVMFLTARIAFGSKLAETEGTLARALDSHPNPGMHPAELPSIIMRPVNPNWKGDPDTHQKHVDFKRLIVKTLRADGREIAFAMDDSHAISKMYAEESVLSLRVYNHIDEASYSR